eukprot:CAMPEP_0175337496 /NCGR_PEP_ID=MMETSP0095-20121207/4354_1 /TAXON_ID=311494 /ORGANISM="Alexandrium monilatum, Strain CCMP3105" /LENGTH=271 /DNA_ID=CAMNT_0016634879 /DNA_START=13 /DNA_END=825 /DNA_ORIENTATION=-
MISREAHRLDAATQPLLVDPQGVASSEGGTVLPPLRAQTKGRLSNAPARGRLSKPKRTQATPNYACRRYPAAMRKPDCAVARTGAVASVLRAMLNARGASYEAVQASARAERGVDGPKLDHRELDLGVRVGCPEVRGLALRAARAGPAEHAGLAGGLVRGVGGVQPEHADVGVVPEGEHENHAAVERRAHVLKAPLPREVVAVAKLGLLRPAEGVRDGVAAAGAQDPRLGVRDDPAALHVEAADLREVARVRPIGGQELGDDRDRLGGVDG